MPKKILLAEDSITIQKVVELTFSDGDYEVTAVNNGARAILKLSEMRPDIILSDIIMPEKNGYEVCEFVKSHPEYRTIPVILLTGTFEPFDPDRADKAGCDAVVTKPFESQSLIHKVEELIEQSRSAAPSATENPAPASTPEPEATPWMDEPPKPPATSPFAVSGPGFTPGNDAFTHSNDIFGTGPVAARPTSDMPFAAPPPPPEPTTGATNAFPKMTFGGSPVEPSEEMVPPSDSSPFGASPAAEESSSDTRAFPKMGYGEMPSSSQSTTPPPPPSEAANASLWDEQPPAFAAETRAFPRVTFNDMEKPAPLPPPAWSPSYENTSSREDDRQPASSAPAAPAFTGNGAELSEEQIDRIARRVIQLMSDQVVRSIAWEVIPDLAEMVVKERIRQLENE